MEVVQSDQLAWEITRKSLNSRELGIELPLAMGAYAAV